MDSIVLRVPELKRLAATMAKDKIDFVQISLTGGDGGTLPPSAAFTGLRADCPWELIDYDELNTVPGSEADFSIVEG